jgi:hypothetical protein
LLLSLIKVGQKVIVKVLHICIIRDNNISAINEKAKMHDHFKLDAKSLQTKLQNYQLVIEVNKELIAQDSRLQEKVTVMMDEAQACIDPLLQGKELGDGKTYDDLLSNANEMMNELHDLITSILTSNTSQNDEAVENRI